MGKKQKSQKNNKNVLKEIESEDSSESGDREIPEVMVKKHRREKDKGILSRGQRKRLFKKAKFYGREELIKRLEESNLQNKANTSKTLIKQKIKKQNEDKQFFFNQVDNELMNLIEEVGKENNINLSEAKLENKLETKQVNGKDNKKVNKDNNRNKDNKDKNKQKPVVSVSNQAKNLIKANTFKSNKNKRYKVNKLIEDEKEKISSVLNNQVFQNNPIESVKNHIYQTQLINERNLQSNKNFMNHMKNINSMKQKQ